MALYSCLPTPCGTAGVVDRSCAAACAGSPPPCAAPGRRADGTGDRTPTAGGTGEGGRGTGASSDL